MPPRKPKQKAVVQAKTILYQLNCEWQDCCSCFDSIEGLLSHVSDHLQLFLVKVNESLWSVSQDQEAKTTCEWRECGCQLDADVPTISRHVFFHAFHTKIKFIGQTLLERSSLTGCTLDSGGRNMIPELPESLTCGWDTCGCIFDNPELFYRHVDTHIEGFEKGNKPDSPVKCYWEGCHHVLKSRHKLKHHLRSHSQEKVVACPVCGSLFANNTKLLDHVSRQMGAEGNSYQCSHCNRRYPTERLLRDHMRHHVNHYKCPLCDMTCPWPSTLKLHMQYRHTDVKPYVCDQCGYSCKMAADLTKHLESHTETKYKCSADGCQFEGKTFLSLSKHFTAVHQRDRPVVYMCHLCKRQYSRGTILTQHLKKKHNFKWPSGHVRFRYKLHDDGFMRLQTVRYESVDVAAFDSDQQTSTDAADVSLVNSSDLGDQSTEVGGSECDTSASQMNISAITALMVGEESSAYNFMSCDNTQLGQLNGIEQQFMHSVTQSSQEGNHQVELQHHNPDSTQVHQAPLVSVGSDRFHQTDSGSDEVIQETYNLQMLGEVALHLPQPTTPDKAAGGGQCGSEASLTPLTLVKDADGSQYGIDTSSSSLSSGVAVEKRKGAQRRKSPVKSKRRKLENEDEDMRRTLVEMGITITN